MIPHRSLGRENYGDGVSYRVVACRKRLRIVRAEQGAQIHGETDAQMIESEIVSVERPGTCAETSASSFSIRLGSDYRVDLEPETSNNRHSFARAGPAGQEEAGRT